MLWKETRAQQSSTERERDNTFRTVPSLHISSLPFLRSWMTPKERLCDRQRKYIAVLAFRLSHAQSMEKGEEIHEITNE